MAHGVADLVLFKFTTPLSYNACPPKGRCIMPDCLLGRNHLPSPPKARSEEEPGRLELAKDSSSRPGSGRRGAAERRRRSVDASRAGIESGPTGRLGATSGCDRGRAHSAPKYSESSTSDEPPTIAQPSYSDAKHYVGWRAAPTAQSGYRDLRVALWKREAEGSSLFHLSLSPHLAPVTLDDPLHRRQTDPTPLELVGRI